MRVSKSSMSVNYFSENVKSILRKNFKKLDKNDLEFFTTILDTNSIEYDNDNDNLNSYNKDWMNKYKGNSELILKPKNLNEVSKVLSYCNANNLAVVPQSGNTGLVGGSVPVFDEIIINMQKMDKIINYNNNDHSILCEAGCILQNLNDFLEKFHRIMPIDLGAKGSCMIGGNLATNAGGIHFIKFGSLRQNVNSLTVVLPNGEISKLNSKSKFDLSQLFIGSEGTLGIITHAEIATAEVSKYKSLCVIRFKSFEEVIDCYMKANNYFKDNLFAIEFFDQGCLEMIHKLMNKPLIFKSEGDCEQNSFYVLIQNISNDSDSNKNSKTNSDDLYNEDNPAFNSLTDFLISNKLDTNCIITDDPNKQKDLWSYREEISPACGKLGLVFKYDVSLPLTEFYKLVEDIRNRIGNKAITVGYGHIGDYNLHLNVCYNKFDFDEECVCIQNILEPYVFDYLKSVNGSISAEHGVGLAKAKFLNRSQSEDNIKLMKRIKSFIDPKGIMNPYKLL